MFEIGFTELLLVAIVALLVLGPERLPQALRTLGLWLGRMRRSFNAVKNEIEKEIGMDEIRRQLHNEAVMDELKRIERDVRSTAQAASGRTPASAPGAGEPPGTRRVDDAHPDQAIDAPPTEPPTPAAIARPEPAARTAEDASGEPARSGARQDG